MSKKKRILLIFLLLCSLGIALFGARHDALAAGGGLEVHEETTYTVMPGEERILVHTTIDLVNHDPTTRKRKRGSYYYYDRLFWLLPKGASDIRAERGDGTRLTVRRKKKEREYDLYTIRFRRQLTYNQKTRIELEYVIARAQPPFYVSPNVVSVPLFQLDGQQEWVTSGKIFLRFPKGFEISQFTDYCEVNDINSTVTCDEGVSSQPVGDLYVIEGERAAEAKELLSDPIPLQEQAVRIRVRYVSGEDAWAQKIVSVLTRALPELERIHGFPYQGSDEIEVRRSTSSDIWGYEGMLMDEDSIYIQPNAPNSTIVHEAAHLWSRPFEPVWLFEGWAEWSAREAVQRLEMDPESYPYRISRRDKIKMPLQDWDHAGLYTEEDEKIEEYGYAKSFDTMKRLVKLAGLEKLQKANAFFATMAEGYPPTYADSYSYFEYLLQNTPNKKKNKQLRKLWRGRVLNAEGKKLLSQRDDMWMELQALEAQAQEIGWDTPTSLEKEMLYWEFPMLKQNLALAQKTLKVWEQALPLFDALGWQPDELIRHRFETSSAWERTLELAQQHLYLAQRAVKIQARLQDSDLDAATRAAVTQWMDEASKALSQGDFYQAQRLVNRAWVQMAFVISP